MKPLGDVRSEWRWGTQIVCPRLLWCFPRCAGCPYSWFVALCGYLCAEVCVYTLTLTSRPDATVRFLSRVIFSVESTANIRAAAIDDMTTGIQPMLES